jgi:hypothetical protein
LKRSPIKSEEFYIPASCLIFLGQSYEGNERRNAYVMLIENFQIRKSRGSPLTCHTDIKRGGVVELAIHSFSTSMLEGGERSVQGLGILFPE